MKIGFFARKSIPIQANSLEQRPLGGTETGLVRLAAELDRRGFDVTVFTSMPNPEPSHPRYLPFGMVHQCGPFDAFVFVQEWQPAFLRVPCRAQFFWTGDGYDQFSNFGLGDQRVVGKIDRLLTVSNWHRETLCEASGFPADKTEVVGNGVHLADFEGTESRNRKRLIYTAAPYRGLRLVPPVYLELKRRHPELELHIFAGLNVYDREQPFRGRYVAEYKKLARVLRAMPGCYIHGNVVQSQLARELMKSSVFLYPNFHFETCCITAIEAQAAGCPVVASFNSALPQTVDDAGVLIGGVPGSVEYSREMIDEIDRLLTDDDHWQAISQRGLQRAQQEFGWGHVADRFERIIEESVGCH